MLNDVAGVELVVVALLGKNYRRIERAGSARRAVRHKMNVGKVGGLALQIRIGRRLRARKYGALSRREIILDPRHFRHSLRQFWKFRVRRNGIANQQKLRSEEHMSEL